LPVLKNGTCFSSTATDSPVRGFRPIRGSRFFTEKAPKATQLNAITLSHRIYDFFKYRAYDFFNVTLMKMRIFIHQFVNQF